MALAVYVDNVLFFGPDTKEMRQVVNKLKFQGFELKIEKEANKMVYDFLGIHIERTVGEDGIDTVKMISIWFN